MLAMKEQQSQGSISAQFGTPERVEWHLVNWAMWMRSGREGDGFGESTGVSSGGSSQHFEDMCDESDKRCAKITNTIIEDLGPGEQMAIHHAYLHAVFRFQRGNLAELLAMAKIKVGIGLNKRGVW